MGKGKSPPLLSHYYEPKLFAGSVTGMISSVSQLTYSMYHFPHVNERAASGPHSQEDTGFETSGLIGSLFPFSTLSDNEVASDPQSL